MQSGKKGKLRHRMIDRRTLAQGIAAALIVPPRAHAAISDSAFGPVRIPDHPRRIVTLDTAGAVALNAGLIPVGTTVIDPADLTAQGRARLAQVPLVGQSTYERQLRYERILALDPDLIVGMIRGGANYERLHRRLSPIAPTVLLRAQGAGTLLDVTHQLAQVMGLGVQAGAERAAYQARVAQLRDRWQARLGDQPVAVLSGQDRGIILYAANSWSGRILRDLGAELPPLSHEAEGNGLRLSYEEIDLLSPVGAILYPELNGHPAPEVSGYWDLPLFRALPAVSRGHFQGLGNIWPETYRSAMPFLDGIASLLNKMEGS